MIKDMVCIVCPMGCKMTIENDIVKHNECKRGEKYAINELTNPTRMLTSTIKLENGFLPRIPVRTDNAIPKFLIPEIMDIINDAILEAPIKMGDVVIKNVKDTNINIIATRSIYRI